MAETLLYSWPKQPHDEAIGRVGLMLFRDWWIDDLTPAELALGNLHADREGNFRRGIARGEPLPDSVKDAIAAAHAVARYNIWSAQILQVIRWLDSQGIDCSSSERFDSVRFEKWFEEKFSGYADTDRARRQASVRKLHKTMNPGARGGCTWPVFCDAVRKDCGQDFDNRTIENDVRALRHPE
jgi:hypothetical protein